LNNIKLIDTGFEGKQNAIHKQEAPLGKKSKFCVLFTTSRDQSDVISTFFSVQRMFKFTS